MASPYFGLKEGSFSKWMGKKDVTSQHAAIAMVCAYLKGSSTAGEVHLSFLLLAQVCMAVILIVNYSCELLKISDEAFDLACTSSRYFKTDLEAPRRLAKPPFQLLVLQVELQLMCQEFEHNRVTIRGLKQISTEQYFTIRQFYMQSMVDFINNGMSSELLTQLYNGIHLASISSLADLAQIGCCGLLF